MSAQTKVDASVDHKSVMLGEVLEFLKPADNEVYIDATFGAGGYTSAILAAADCTVHAFDRDESVKAYADVLSKKYGNKFHLHNRPFSEMDEVAQQVDGVVFDLGVSSMQLDQAERGFSFMKEAPLDMRMGKATTRTAQDFLKLSEREMSDIIFNYGEERHSRRIAAAIILAHKIEPITTTTQLAKVISSAVITRGAVIHPATRTFQAIRIWVNDELEELKIGLEAAFSILKVGGRMVIVSFHSLEDRLVKIFVQKYSSSKPSFNRHLPHKPKVVEIKGAVLKQLVSGAAKCTKEESMRNPRARSAKLRAVIKQIEEA